jgi:hypothetical protein
MLLPIIIAIIPSMVLADPRLKDRPPLLHFESNYHDAFATADQQRRRASVINGHDLCSSAIEPPVSPLDLRITKANAKHGYNVMRVSVITYSMEPPAFVSGSLGGNATDEDESLSWDYSGAFKYRWTSQVSHMKIP